MKKFKYIWENAKIIYQEYFGQNTKIFGRIELTARDRKINIKTLIFANRSDLME